MQSAFHRLQLVRSTVPCARSLLTVGLPCANLVPRCGKGSTSPWPGCSSVVQELVRLASRVVWLFVLPIVHNTKVIHICVYFKWICRGLAVQFFDSTDEPLCSARTASWAADGADSILQASHESAQ